MDPARHIKRPHVERNASIETFAPKWSRFDRRLTVISRIRKAIRQKIFATDFPAENHDLLLNIVSDTIDNDRVNHRQIKHRKSTYDSLNGTPQTDKKKTVSTSITRHLY
jgi:hypothetical protein